MRLQDREQVRHALPGFRRKKDIGVALFPADRRTIDLRRDADDGDLRRQALIEMKAFRFFR